MHTFSVVYSILKWADGHIVFEAEVATGQAETKALAEFEVVRLIRHEFPSDVYRVIVHEVIDHDAE